MGLLDFLKFGRSGKDEGAQPETQGQAANFEALVLRTKQARDKDSLDALWGAAYALENWYFIGTGTGPDIGPHVSVIEDKPFLLAFTDPEQAAGCAQRLGLADPQGGAHLLAIPVAGLAQSVQAYVDKGVYGLWFNDGPDAFYTPFSDVAAMYLHHRPK
jgi:hypothetical protein